MLLSQDCFPGLLYFLVDSEISFSAFVRYPGVISVDFNRSYQSISVYLSEPYFLFPKCLFIGFNNVSQCSGRSLDFFSIIFGPY